MLNTTSQKFENDSFDNFSNSNKKSSNNDFIEGFQITKKNTFKIINPEVSVNDSIIKSEDIRPIDECNKTDEILEKLTVGQEYFYNKISDDSIIKVKLLRVSGNYAFFSTGKFGIKVKISNLENRLKKIDDKFIFPSFDENKKEVIKNDNEKNDNLINFFDKKITPSYLKEAFSKFSNISAIEKNQLSKNKIGYLEIISSNISNLNNGNVNVLPAFKKISNLYENILSITNNNLKNNSILLFKKYYQIILQVRKNYLINELFDDLDFLFGKDLLIFSKYYDDLDFTKKIIFTNKIKKDISLFLDSKSQKNDILSQRLKIYLSKNIFSLDDIESIYILS